VQDKKKKNFGNLEKKSEPPLCRLERLKQKKKTTKIADHKKEIVLWNEVARQTTKHRQHHF